MLNLKSLKDSLIPLKVMAAPNFVSAISNSLTEAKSQIDVFHEDNESNYNEVFNEGLEILKEFGVNKNPSKDKIFLQKAANKFAEAISLKRIKPAPYYYLAYIFYLLNDISLSLNYLKVITAIDPNFPNLENLYKKVNEKSKVSNTLNESKPNTAQVGEAVKLAPLKKVMGSYHKY